MSKDSNNSLLLAPVFLFGLFMMPFMMVGRLWGKTLDQMEVLNNGGGHLIYRWALEFYGGWHRWDGMEQGFSVIGVVIAVVVLTPAAYIYCLFGVYAGLGIYLFNNPISLTPWTAVNHIVIPIVLGLIQVGTVAWLFRKRPQVPLVVAAIPACAIPFMMVILPVLLMILTGVHTLLR